MSLNQRANTLTKLGVFICNILDFIDKDHCKKSIKNYNNLTS